MAKVGDRGRQHAELVLRSPPRFEERIYWPHSIAAIVAELTKQGIDAQAALEGTGLTASQLDTYTTKISYRQLDIAIRNALRLSSDPAIALRAGQRMHVTSYGMYGYALLSSATHAEACSFAARYLRIVGPLCDVVSLDEGLTVPVTFEPLHWPDPTEDAHRFAVEFSLSAHLAVARDRVGQRFSFSRVNVDYAAPPHANVYRSLFECPVLFEQQSCVYEHVREDDLAELADPRTHAMAREICEQLLREVNRAGGVAADVWRILIERPGRFPNIKAIALKMEMHPRALRRKLEAEGSSYSALLAEVRRQLAIEYLRKTQMVNKEIASRLGYSDEANFRHAFLRWTGKSPSEFRGRARTGRCGRQSPKPPDH
jgi:AraC-like DNA-binding protein